VYESYDSSRNITSKFWHRVTEGSQALVVWGNTPFLGQAMEQYSFRNILDMRLPHVISKEESELMATRTASDIEQSTEKLLQDLKEVVRDGEELLRAGAEDLGERGAAAKEKLAAALEVAKETQRRLQERAIEGAKAADNFIRTNPYQAIGVAFGVGMLLGLLASRRS